MADSPHDQEALDLLDDYLARLQAGQRPDRAEFLRRRPDLESVLQCLEALEGVASAVGGEAPPSAAEAPPGDLPRAFGPYELLSEIGRGGMGVVYKARQTTLDRIVAVKMILANQLASPEHVRRFHVEARAAARLQHSNIVHIHEVGHLLGQHYIAMEYIDGQSLAARLSRGPLDTMAAVRILAAVARAVELLHQQNIIHRDLKPSNILLDADDHPYVTDFGLAKMFGPGSESTTTGVIAGTFSYMAPEQAAGQGSEVGPPADVYSLGAILYELLTGRPPFREENPLDTWMAVLSREPVPPRRLNPRIPLGLELICMKCLAKSAGDRYASSGALADDLEHFARGDPLDVHPPHLAERVWSWTRRQPALAMRLGALGVFFVVEWINYWARVPGMDLAFHVKMMSLLGGWAVVAFVCQQFLESGRWPISARFVWGSLDSILLLAVLLVADGVASPLIVAYPLLIVASGLWFRVRFVWFMTLLSVLSYGILIVDSILWRPELQERAGFNHHLVLLVGLCILGAVQTYLVHRVRTLSSFYGRQMP
jgi:serine/threonine-protein kinase